MTYGEFNKKVLDFYISRSSSKYITLEIDQHDIQQLISIEELRLFHNLKSHWYLLPRSVDNTPQYFGLIAIQCLAGSIMEDDGKYSENDYQNRLITLLGLTKSLQILFRGDDGNNPIQEQLWSMAKQYFESTYGLSLAIPDVRYFKGRYVQYPLSQVLLNTEDLKYFSLFFNEEFQINENIPFSYFKRKLDKWLSNTRQEKISKRAKKLLEDKDKKESCTEQIFNFFNRWTGDLYNARTSKNKNSKPIANAVAITEQQKIVLIFQDGAPAFYVKEKTVSGNSILKIPRYKYIYKNILLFSECDYYPDEYEDSRFLDKHTASFILLHPQLCPRENRYLEQHNSSMIKMPDGCILYKLTTNENHIHSVLREYFRSGSPVKLRNGLKISRANSYLKGYGPSIEGAIEAVILDNKKINYDPENADNGLYKVRSGNYRDLEFTIAEPYERSLFIQPKQKGWNLKQIAIDPDFNVQGGLLKLNYECEDKPIIRAWINANLAKDKKLPSANILIRAIKYSLP
jgi:hypothetical protein